MADDEEEFDHQVTPWTAGQLRKALGAVPDDWPVLVYPAEEPGGEMLGEQQVVVSAGEWVSGRAWPRGVQSAGEMRALLERGDVRSDCFEITLEFPSGRYLRRRSDG